MLALLDNLFLQPLMLIYAFIFNQLHFLSVGTAIVTFSLVLNLFLMPLYSTMEKGSRAARQVKEMVDRDVARMKLHFKGRERYFYIRAVHRQYRYHPLSALTSSRDLLVQVIVFATVYHFISGQSSLHGAAFGPISDLARPDQLLGGVNLLPLLMTAINAFSVIAYVGNTHKRLQAFGLAGLFLALLYQSPAGLVLYWTSNNLFSLVRNALDRLFSGRDSSTMRAFLANLSSQR